MTIKHILVCAPTEGGFWHQALFDIALSFSYSLKTLGHDAPVTIDPAACTGKTLVFGAHTISKFSGTIEGGDYILFNSEQMTEESGWITPAYLDILRRYEVWDYSFNNIAALASHGIEAKYCAIGYHPCMSNIALGKSATLVGGATSPLKVEYVEPGLGNACEPIDVLFYGTKNGRRIEAINALRDKGVNVVSLTGFGAYRDKYIKAAKIVLNMHYYESAVFEILRVSHLLANRKCVVSESGKDTQLEEPYREGISFVDFDGIVSGCLDLLSSGDARDALAQKGLEALKARSQADILKELLA